jgi:ribosome biogenesis GTPase / thiamine phosphate phosphatase
VAQVYGANVGLWDGHSIQEALLAQHLKSDAASRHSNPLAVGDEVEVESSDSGPIRVVSVAPRRTFLERSTGDSRGRTQIIAANATQAVIISSLAEPPFRPGLVDRWGLLARRGGLVPVLCLNKVDLGTHEEAEGAIAEAAIPLESVTVSAETGSGIDRLQALVDGRASVFVGHSGVGKSSLLRHLVPNADALTGAVSAKNLKGRHTTTSSRLYPLPAGGIVIDTPGVRSVRLGQTEAGEVAAVFHEIAEAPPCRFRTCTHRSEPGCSVLAGVESGAVPDSVYTRYRKLLEEVQVK